MGKINSIWQPSYWKIILEGKNKKDLTDIVYKMIIGEGVDENYYEIVEFISKDNYENILNNRYNIEIYPYSEIQLILFDENGLVIPLVKEDEFDFNKLNDYQKKVIKEKYQKSNKKELIRKK